MSSYDVGAWRCPKCGAIVEGGGVVDPTLGTRIREHKEEHEDIDRLRH